jgi:hypothetical protein
LLCGTQKERSNFGNIELTLARTLANKKVLIRFDSMRSDPTLRDPDKKYITASSIDGDFDRSNLETWQLGFRQTNQNILNAPNRFVSTRGRLGHDLGSASVIALCDSEDQVSAASIRECCYIC